MTTEDQNQASRFWAKAPFPTLVAANQGSTARKTVFKFFPCYFLDQCISFSKSGWKPTEWELPKGCRSRTNLNHGA